MSKEVREAENDDVQEVGGDKDCFQKDVELAGVHLEEGNKAAITVGEATVSQDVAGIGLL